MFALIICSLGRSAGGCPSCSSTPRQTPSSALATSRTSWPSGRSSACRWWPKNGPTPLMCSTTGENCPCVALQVRNGPCVALQVRNGPCVALQVRNGPCVALQVRNGPCVALQVRNGPCVALQVRNGPCVAHRWEMAHVQHCRWEMVHVWHCRWEMAHVWHYRWEMAPVPSLAHFLSFFWWSGGGLPLCCPTTAIGVNLFDN